MTYDRKDLPGIADEYVLGLLDATEAAEIEAEMERDTKLDTAIAASEERFLPLDTSVVPAAVDEALWQKSEAALLTAHTATTPDPTPSSAKDNLRNGRRATALSTIAAMLLLTIGLCWSLMRTGEPVVITVLINDAGEAQAVVEDLGNENAPVRLLHNFDVPADKTIQVWTLPSREMGPVSLGLIDRGRFVKLRGPSLPIPQGDQLYQITLEQQGGLPTGRPTGQILAKGLAKAQR